MEAVIFIGLQGAGKSTSYKERFFDSHLRINLDMLRTRHRDRRFLQTCVETGQPFVVDNRISELPSVDLVVDYFRWRNEDAHRNALNAHGYWLLRKKGKTVNEATAAMSGLSVAQKSELLFQHGVNFNDLPLWQKRGSGLYWEKYERLAENPVTGEKVVARIGRLLRIAQKRKLWRL